MAQDKNYTKKLFLRIGSDGHIKLDREYLWEGCDTPEIDPEIQLEPVAISKLTELTTTTFLETAEQGDAEKLEILERELEQSHETVRKAIADIKAKFS